MTEKILIIDDEPNIVRSFSSLLSDEGHKTVTAETAEDGLKAVEDPNISLILLDLNLPGMSGIEFLKKLKTDGSSPLVLVISGQSDIPTALEAIKLGAIDYLEKPVAPEKLISSVRSALLLAEANRQRNMLIDDIDQRSLLLGNSKAIKKLNQLIQQVAPADTTVLITGENGTGKELAATRIFLQSTRRHKPFIKVNCPGIPDTLFESELFGHTKGSFTGAVKDYPGKFVLADGGTIFLDEIGDLPLESQAKLLRVLESGEVETIGAVDKKKVDVRVICATNRDLPLLVRNRKFREDLYYRISVFNVAVPPLRERIDDIAILAGEFLKRLNPTGTTKISSDAMAYLTTLSFPGNVRELKNIIERLTILYNDKTVTVGELISQTSSGTLKSEKVNECPSLTERINNYEKQLIKEILQSCAGNISKAAVELKVDRANLSKKIKEYGLK